MKIYRVENLYSGCGPYRTYVSEGGNTISTTIEDEFQSDLRCSQKHPTPCEDGMGYIDGDVFGFLSKEQYKAWFNYIIRKGLKKYNCFLYVYDVPAAHVIKGKKQVAFKKEYAKIITILDCVTLKERIKLNGKNITCYSASNC